MLACLGNSAGSVKELLLERLQSPLEVHMFLFQSILSFKALDFIPPFLILNPF